MPILVEASIEAFIQGPKELGSDIDGNVMRATIFETCPSKSWPFILVAGEADYSGCLPTEAPGLKGASSVDRRMSLLRTPTFELETFFNERLPPYAILSYMWED